MPLGRCTPGRQGTWAVPATRPMETSFRQESFQKPSVLSAQAAGSDSPLGPRSKRNTKNLRWFLGPHVYGFHIRARSGVAFSCNVKKMCTQDPNVRISYINSLRRGAWINFFNTFFGKVFGPARVRISYVISLRSVFFATSKKCALVWAYSRANMLHGRRPHVQGFH